MNIKKSSIHLASIFVLMLIIFPIFTSAQPVPPPTSPSPTAKVTSTIPNPFKGGSSLLSLLDTILSEIVMPIAAVGVIVWVIWAGFQFVIAQGNPGAIDKAKQNLLWSLVGAGILLGAAGISKVLSATINALIAP